MLNQSKSAAISKETDESIRYRLDRFDRQIGIEFDLIGHRMTWLMISQSFLFSTFATTISASTPPKSTKAVTTLQWLVSGVGILTALFVGLAILAAHQVISRLKPNRDELEKAASSRGFEVLGVESSSRDHFLGNLPSQVLPWVLIAAWVLLVIRILL